MDTDKDIKAELARMKQKGRGTEGNKANEENSNVENLLMH